MQKRAIFLSLIFSILMCIAVLKAPQFRFIVTNFATAVDSPSVYYKLGDCHYKGIFVEHDLTQAEFWYQKAADRNHGKAMYKLGNLYSHRHSIQKNLEVVSGYWDSIPLDLPRAISCYLGAAKLKYVSGYVRLGYFNVAGIGMPVDYKKSFQWYRKAAKTGDSLGQVWLGYFYSNGIGREWEWEHDQNCWNGIEKNYSKALKYYLKAANQGMDLAQYMVGFMYAHGAINADRGIKGIDTVDLEIPGIPLDYQEAIKWYTKAAKQEYKKAHLKLGYFYLHTNYAVKKDHKKAFEWWMKGTENEYGPNMRRVGICYADGIGVPQDDEKALQWLQRAAQTGNIYAQEYLEEYAQNAAVYFTRAVVGDVQKGTPSAEVAEHIRADFYKTFKSQGVVFPYSNPTAF